MNFSRDQITTSTTEDLLTTASRHLGGILSLAFDHTEAHSALIVYDQRCALAQVLAEAYQRCLPRATAIDFDASSPEAIWEAIDELKVSDLVVLVQSTSFRLEKFRLRVELFKRGMQVIEHPHLSRMLPDQAACYIDSLAYDPGYLRSTGKALKLAIDTAGRALVSGGGEELLFSAGFEDAQLNVGDYREMKNAGGQFPIGEVFTESLDLAAVNGRIQIFAFGGRDFRVKKPASLITLRIEQGQVIESLNSTPEFDEVLATIRADEGGVVWVRELGFGLNRAFTRDRIVDDVGTYERMCGVHLSLGAKHSTYAKPNFKRDAGRHHVDVFVVADSVLLDAQEVYRDGSWQLG